MATLTPAFRQYAEGDYCAGIAALAYPGAS
jgi:hypothetical protein